MSEQGSIRRVLCFVARVRDCGLLFLVLSGLFQARTFAVEHGAPKSASRPNIVFIFSDDHALRTIGAYGAGINETPNIDRIANEGILFTRSYCANSICCPSRANILTGKHSHKNGVLDNADVWNGDQFVFTRRLGEAGYNTALIGKWHMMKGTRGSPGDSFDYWNILTGAGGQGDYYNPEFVNKDGEPSKVTGYSTDIITDQALAWLETERDSSKPFLLMCQYKSPHIHRIPPPRHMTKYDGEDIPEPVTMFDDYKGRSPYAADTNMEFKMMQDEILNIAPPAGAKLTEGERRKYDYLERMTTEQRAAYHEAYDPENSEYRRLRSAGELADGSKALERYKYQRFIKDYLRCVAAIDDNVGRIFDYLEEHGLAENTVVIYSSDQGFYTGEHGWNDKRWMYEESFAMPFMLRWPAQVQPGQKCDALIQNIDYAPTFLDLAGAEIPKDLDGRSLRPLLTGDEPEDWRDALYYHYYEDGSYNLPRFEGVSDGRYKLINYYYPKQAWELFDLVRDPHELESVYEKPDYAAVVATMKENLARLREQYKVPPLAKGKVNR
jgi:arylsulfatase A-like enzyme